LGKTACAAQGRNSHHRKFIGEFTGGRTMSKSLSITSDGKVIYQLNPNLKYRPNKLDSSDYADQVVCRRSTTEDVGPEAERGGAEFVSKLANHFE
jgi:hypothetical protein